MASSPRKPRQQRAKATVEAIIRAAFEDVAEYGLPGATAQRIAERAGVGIGSFYEYFSNKDAVVVEVFQRVIDMTVTLIRELTPAMVRLEIRDAIRLLLYRVADMLRADGGIYLRCVQQGLITELPIDRSPVQRALTDLAMQYLMHHPQYLRGPNIPVATYVFIHGGMHAYIYHLNDPAPAITFEQLVDGLADMIGHYAEREMQLAAGSQG